MCQTDIGYMYVYTVVMKDYMALYCITNMSKYVCGNT